MFLSCSAPIRCFSFRPHNASLHGCSSATLQVRRSLARAHLYRSQHRGCGGPCSALCSIFFFLFGKLHLMLSLQPYVLMTWHDMKGRKESRFANLWSHMQACLSKSQLNSVEGTAKDASDIQYNRGLFQSFSSVLAHFLLKSMLFCLHSSDFRSRAKQMSTRVSRCWNAPQGSRHHAAKVL